MLTIITPKLYFKLLLFFMPALSNISHLNAQGRGVDPSRLEQFYKNFAESRNRDEPYGPGPESKKYDSVPAGTVTKYHWIDKGIYAGTERDYWLYVPKQYVAAKPACLMIFFDGHAYLGADVQANIVLDNLINKRDVSVIVGLFISPGDKGPGNPINGGTTNRSLEYDAVNDTFPRFLIEEMIPEIKKKYNITDDPEGRALVGQSSGGICAFNAAWQRPDAFRKVISHNGSFVNIRGGDRFPELIRSSLHKPIKVFLQTGQRDLNSLLGNWGLRNQEMASSLEFAGYDYKFVFGEGGHTLMHGGAIFPNTMRWLWKDYPKN